LIGQAAKANAELAKEALSWYMGEYEKNKPRQAALDAKSMEFADQQMETSRFQTQVAREQWDRYKTVGMAAEDAMYKDAANYDSASKQAEAAGEAATDVQTAIAKARTATARERARAGVNPADGRALAMEQDQATASALAEASAMTSARKGVRDMGIMLRKDAASAARGMPSTAAQTYGVASTAGAGATGAIQGSIASANQSVATAGQGFNTAVSANNSAGSILNQEYGNRVQAEKGSGALQALGGIGMGLGAMGWKPFG
jgi:hypothetical protein